MSLPDPRVAPIGGYFELDLPNRRQLPYPEALKFQSARAAFLALLRAGKPKRVWMPNYICDAMLAPLDAAGISCAWYDVDDRLNVDGHIHLGSDEWLLYVNYFGVCRRNVRPLLERYSPRQVVLDYSQAFFAPPAEHALATLYSPRKFFGVPDGGLLISRISVPLPEFQDTDSFERISHLIRRLGDSPEAGYADYQRAEESLVPCEPKRISKLTERILSSIDFDTAERKRLENFLFLHERLGEDNGFPLDSSCLTAPLCYPFLSQDPELRNKLINNRIFVATYWSDTTARMAPEKAKRLVRNLLPLPIDQRYGRKDMERLVSVIRDRNI